MNIINTEIMPSDRTIIAIDNSIGDICAAWSYCLGSFIGFCYTIVIFAGFPYSVYFTIQGDDSKFIAGVLGASSASLSGFLILCMMCFRHYWQNRVQQAMTGTGEALVIGTPVSPDLEPRNNRITALPYHVITAQF